MKKIQLKSNSLNNFLDTKENLLEKYLLSLGIKEKDIDSFLFEVKEKDKDDYNLLSNIDKAIEAARLKLDGGSKDNPCNVFIQVDSDTDGWTSSAILIQYLNKKYGESVNIEYKLHPGKEHGINLEYIKDKTDIVFIPDAGSNDFDEQAKLVESGKTVIILDHHHITNYQNTGAIIVNNQISANFDNKNLSGAGVTYLFINALDDSYKIEGKNVLEPREFMDLAATGIIADAMDMSSLGNNYLSSKGLFEIKNKFLLELGQHQSRGIKNPSSWTKMDVSFYIAPVINGVIRSGSQEDKDIVFKALISNNGETDFYESEYRGKQRKENLYEYAVRLATNAKSRQDNGKKKGFELICEKIKENKLDQNSLIIVTLTPEEEKKVPNNITGLVAMELMKFFNRPCLLLRKTIFNDEEVYGGSGRSGNYHFLPSLLKFLHDSNLVEYAEGHDAAFGVFIKESNIEALTNYANEKIKLSNFDDDIQEVDAWFLNWDEVTENMDSMMKFAEANNIWGIGIPKPNFAFSLTLEPKDFETMGADGTSIKINKTFVTFKNEKLRDLIINLKSDDLVKMTIVGSPTLNEWKGYKNIQIIFNNDDYNFEVVEKPKSFASLI